MPVIDRSGVRIHYTVHGPADAPALTLIRGLARSSRYWLEFRHRLAERYRVVLIDNRGVLHSDAPSPPYTTATMADDVAAVLDDAGIARSHVFGISLGGMIAQELTLRHPDRVDRLVLAATTAGGARSRRTPLRAIYVLLRGGTMPFDVAIRYTSQVVLAAGFIEGRDAVLDQWIELARDEPPPFRGLVGQLLAAARHDASARLHRVSSPTLVVTGDADELIDPRNSYVLLELLADARLHVVDGGGHDFVTERPAESAAIVARFLDERSPQ